MLVVVEDGDVALLLQLALDLKAPGGGDVLQVDAAKGAGDVVDGLDKLVHVLGLDAQGEGVHIGKALEEDALALHHGHAGLGADVAQAQHRGAVGDDGHQVVAAGELIALLRMLLDLQTGLGHAGGVGQGQGLLVVGGHGGDHFDFSLPLPVEAEGFLGIIHSFVLTFLCSAPRPERRFGFIIPAFPKNATGPGKFSGAAASLTAPARRDRPGR